MALGYGNKFNGVKMERKDFINFIKHRIIKLYPVYFFSMAYVFMFEIIKSMIEHSFTFYSFLKELAILVFSATMLQTLTIKYWNLLNSAAWFIATIFICYLLTPYIFYMVGRIKKKNMLVMGLVILYAVMAFGYIASFFVDEDIELLFLFFYVSPYFRILFYLMGIFSAYIFMDKESTHNKGTIWQISATVLSLFAYFISISQKDFYYSQYNLYLTPIFLFLIYAYTKDGVLSRFFSGRFFPKMGNLSMYIYLLHYVIINYVAVFFLDGIDDTAVLCLASVGLLIFTIIFSYIFVRIQDYFLNKYLGSAIRKGRD